MLAVSQRYEALLFPDNPFSHMMGLIASFVD